MGNNGGYNPYRDRNGRWATPETHGKATGGAGGAKEIREIWTANPPPKTSRLGKPLGWAYSPSPLPPKYRGKPKPATKPAPAPKAKAPTVPKKYRDYSDMSSQADKLDRLHQEAQRKYDATQHRSRYPSADAHGAARKAALAELERVGREASQVRKDRNEYLDAMARYRSQSDYRYDD